MQDLYSDIRPYNDEEVARVLERLLDSKELNRALVRFFYPKIPVWTSAWLGRLMFRKERKKLSQTNSVEEFQHWLVHLLQVLLKRTTDHIEVRGLGHLTPGTSYVWISNHRDIAMDPLLMNFSLFTQQWPTSRIAIGDNLLNHPDVADIMRLNKSFVVKRNINNRRQKLIELKRLSHYIRSSIEQSHSIWIAQREGRAKNGIDKTDTAVLKMLALHGRDHEESFLQTMQALKPVPVSIQYEWDPCDVLKARELVALQEQGSYLKDESEDTRSILLGLTGKKGRVVVSFGQPLNAAEMVDAEVMAQALDQQILAMQTVLPTQKAAGLLLQKDFQLPLGLEPQPELEPWIEALQLRIANEPKAVRKRVLQTYAAPLCH